MSTATRPTGTDSHGAVLEVTEIAVADELAGAAELVKGKADGIPVAVVRGLALPDDGRGAALGERAQRAHHQRLAVQLDKRLRPAHPVSRAGGQQQPRRSYRFTSVCGWV